MKQIQSTQLEVPNYSIEEAARYLHVPVRTVYNWVIGTENAAPLTTVFSRRPLLLSFKNLVECYVLESLRATVGMSRIRKSVEELRREKPSKYPLADYKLGVYGRIIYLEDEGDELINLTDAGQRAFKPILDPFLHRIELYPRGPAFRLFPFTRKEHIRSPETAPRCVVIDPSVSFGMPVLVDSRISTAFLLSRKRGGATILRLAADYGRSEAEIEEAIKLEEAAGAAKAA
jgi:uncharacterized protein (DUF433 family)